MRFVAIANSDILITLLDPKIHSPALLITSDKLLARRARRKGFATIVGDLSDVALYRRAKVSTRDRVLICLESRTVANNCLDALFTKCPEAAVTMLTLNEAQKSNPHCSINTRCVDITVFTRSLRAELEKAAAVRSVTKLRNIFADADRVLLLLQDDPDPDGIASAMALRAILGRNRATAPIASYGTVNRPENQAMVALLDVEINKVTPEEVKHYSHVALLDVQPFHSPDIPTRIAAVIDHHPRRTNYTAQFRDIRPRYGATATIMTEYLLAAGVTISQRLATALLYGIKTDTQLLGRATTPMDVEAFANLYPLANHSTLRRIDRPQIPRDDLVSFAAALAESKFEQNAIFAHLGPLMRDDVVPYFADLCLEVENTEWSVASGICEGQLIISVRSYGQEQSAGEVVKAAFERYGSAGGHRTMAKGVVPLINLPENCLDHSQWIREEFIAALNAGADK
jgi:nanoRNase/pAp phosphatase (c-di-AMP/oligoRNAs hydrolase)